MKLKKLSFFFFAITAFVLLIAATSLTVSAEEVTYPVEGGNIYFETETGAIVGCDPTITRADIPEYIDGVKVTSIASLAFTQSGTFDSYGTYGVIGTPSLKYVSIPDTVTGIGAYAFCKSSIESIVIPKSVTKLSHDFNYFISSFNGGPKTLYYRGTKSDFQRLLNGYAISQPVVFDYTCEAPYGHSFDTWNITVAQTCTEEGEEQSVCSYCQSETKTRAIPVHSWDNILTTVEPTCTKKGQQLKTCTVCNATETQSIPSAGGHKWNEWTVTVEPTSDTDGKKFRTCTVCGASDSRIMFTNGNIGYSVEGGYIYFNPKTGAIVGCDPTITRADIPPYIDGIKVVGIGKFAFLQSVFPIETTPSLRYISLPDTITYLGMCPFYGTSIESIVLPESLRSLTEAPYPNELCTLGSLAGGPDIAYYRGTREKWRVSVESIGYGNCPIVYDYKCEGLYGHEYNDWTAVTLPTCTEKGEDIRTCSLCGESETRTVSPRHTWSDVITVVKPSCTTTGSGVKSCVNCDVSQTVVIPIEHSFGEWQVIQDYGCIEGIKRRTCTICKTKEEEMLPATEDHSWSEWKEDTAATCTVEGKESHYCLNCNYTESRTVPTNDNHSWSDWNVTIAPTAESEGKEVRLCTVCNATESRVVPKLEETIEYSIKVDNYKVIITGAESIDYIRYAPGVLNTSGEIKNAEGMVPINASVIAENTVNGVYTREMPDGGVYSFWIRFNDGSTVIEHLDLTKMTQSVSLNGLMLTVHDLYGVKDYFIVKGEYTAYNQFKGNYDMRVTASKINGAKDYTYTLKSPGYYTVCVRYTDTTRPDLFLYCDVDVVMPEITVDGLQVRVSNLDDIKVIRTAPGEWSTAGEVKRAAGNRNFTAKNAIKGADPYTIQYREDGVYTIAVEYTTGLCVVETVTIRHKEPTVQYTDTGVIFGELDGLNVIRYAKGEYSYSGDIKRAPGAKYKKPADIQNGVITVDGLEPGTYTFCVQYYDESFNYYVIVVE